MGIGLINRLLPIAKVMTLALLVNLYTNISYGADYTILALGDSLSAGYGLNKGESFPAQLEKKMLDEGHDIRMINAGVSGDTTKGGLARLNWALADKPDMVIVELGANDGLRGLDPALMQDNLDKILSQLKQRNIKVLLAGMYAPPNFGEDYGQKYNEVFPVLAKRHNVTLYPFFLDGVAGIPKLNLEDGIHPTKEGIAIIVKRILPYVLKVKEES